MDITFALELKVKGVAKEIADMIYKYNLQDKVIITSFIFDALLEIKECSPLLKRGYLFFNLDQKTRKEIELLQLYEICPKGQEITKEEVIEYHKKGYAGESVLGLINYLHQNLNVKKVKSRCHKQNLPSYNMLTRLGYTVYKEDGDWLFFEKYL